MSLAQCYVYGSEAHKLVLAIYDTIYISLIFPQLIAASVDEMLNYRIGPGVVGLVYDNALPEIFLCGWKSQSATGNTLGVTRRIRRFALCSHRRPACRVGVIIYSLCHYYIFPCVASIQH